MGLFDLFRGKSAKVQKTELVDCFWELLEASREYQVRELAFWTCVNMVANAFGRCEVRTYENRKEVFGAEYYTWNLDPSQNENSTAFLHHIIESLYTKNEALIIPVSYELEHTGLVVADSWDAGDLFVRKEREYKKVKVGDTEYNKTFRERDVLHLRLNNKDMKPVIDGFNDAFARMIGAAMRANIWQKGQHWKVHISRGQQGDEAAKKQFTEIINAQFKPFLNSEGSVLPEFDGYAYENVSNSGGTADTRDIRSLYEDVFDMTARAFGIPAVIVNGKVEGTKDANTRFLTNVIDPIADQLGEEITRKRYGFAEWRAGNYARVDTSSIIHYDIFDNAASVEKLVGSGAYTINDIRRAAGETPIDEDWADQHYMTKNIARLMEQAAPLEGEEE